MLEQHEGKVGLLQIQIMDSRLNAEMSQLDEQGFVQCEESQMTT